MNRTWTAEQEAAVRREWPATPDPEIAARLGRPAGQVQRMAAKLGLSRWPRWPTAVLDQVRALHAQGLCDRAIAEALPDVFAAGARGRDQAKAIRRRLGLPFHADVEAKRRGLARQLATLGAESFGGLRVAAYRRHAERHGWPTDCRVREVQILDTLAATGLPMTALELATAIGANTSPTFRTGGKRPVLAGNGPGGTYTASLMRQGLVAALPGRQRPGTGKGRSYRLYVLGPVALAILAERAAAEAAREEEA